jgi:hypothetical protein
MAIIPKARNGHESPVRFAAFCSGSAVYRKNLKIIYPKKITRRRDME